MSAKHTAGPWRVVDRDSLCLSIRGDVPRAPDADDYYCSIAMVTQRDAHPRFGGAVSLETTWANARLIAAAPELLEACQEIAFAWRDKPAEAGSALGMVRAAIAKATGETP